MDEATARLGMQLIDPGQAQKEVTHNEALTTLDLLVQASVVAAGANDPPAAPEAGQAWIVGGAPAGAWSGHAQALAGWSAGGWRFVPPQEGMEAWCEADGRALRYTGGVWESGVVRGARLVVDGVAVVGPQMAGIAEPAGGAAPDLQSRAAIGAILAALRGHGLIAS